MAELTPRDLLPVRADLWPHPLTAHGRLRAEAWVPDAGATLLDVLSQLGEPPHGPLIVTVNGLPVPAARWETHLVFPGDLVLCRARLKGGDTNPLQVVLMIGVLALGGWAGAAIGGVAGSLVAGAIVTVGGLLVNALFPPALPDAPDKPKPIYTLTGGANRARPYDPVLMVLGQHRVFPDLAGAHYVEFVGGEQYLHQVFDIGVGDLDITDIRIGDTPLGAYNRRAAPSGDTVEHTVPEFYGRPIYTQWRGNSAANALADVEQQLALPGEPITLVAEDVDTVTGAQLDDTNWHTRTSSLNAARLGLDIVANVLRFSKKGKLRSHTVNLTVQYREQGSTGAWTTVTDPATVITNGSQDPVRRTWFITPPTAGKQWDVRVKRDTAPASDTRTRDEVTWSALRTYQASTANAAGRTRLALRIKATGQLNGRLDRLSALVSARVKTWDQDVAAWSADNAPTSNPGDILRGFAEGVKDRAGRLIAGAGLSLANRIDLPSIQAWREWCHREGLTFNYVLDGAAGLEEMLQLITRAGRASHSWHSGKLGVVYDEAERLPTSLITAGNILAGSLRVEWADGRLADEIVAEYTDPDFDWQPVALRRKVTGVIHPQRSARIRLPGVTDRAQAIEETNLHAARQEYHRRRLTWAMAMEGFSLLRGEVYYLSEALVSGGVTGRLTGGDKAAPQLDQAIDISAGTDYLLLRLADGALHTSVVTHPDGGAGETDTPALATPLPGDPAQGGLAAAADAGVQARDVLWRYYSAANPPLKVKITGVRPLSDDTVEIQAIDEVAAYYTAKDLALTDPLPRLLSRGPKILAINVSETLLETGGGYAVEIVATLVVEGDWRGGVIWAQLNEQERRIVASLSGQETRGAWIEQAEGTLTITAVPGSDVAATGAALTVTHTIGADTVPPDDPEGVTATGIPGGYEVTWTAPEEPDYAVTEILDAVGDILTVSHITVVPRGEVAATVFTRLGVEQATDITVFVRHKDRSGNTSEPVRATVTTLAPPADGVGQERVFCATALGGTITGSANLPDPDWNFNEPDLSSDDGITRGNNVYYQGTPADLGAAKPFVTPFVRTIKGAPAPNADIGTVAWTQEAAQRLFAEDGQDGLQGPKGDPGDDGDDGKDGKDGVGDSLSDIKTQQIYRRTATPIKPNTPRSSAAQKTDDRYTPTGASRTYTAPTQALPYAWVSTRLGKSGGWGDWSGYRPNGTHQSVFAAGTRSAETYPPVDIAPAKAWSDTIANRTTKDSNVITDMVTQYNDTEKWTETRYWDGTAWVKVDVKLSGNYFFDGAIGARKLDVENLSALNIKVRNVDVEGVIQAEHISADVINVETLWSGSATVTLSIGVATRTDVETIALDDGFDLDDYGSILILGSPDVNHVQSNLTRRTAGAGGQVLKRVGDRSTVAVRRNSGGTALVFTARQTGSFGNSADAISYTVQRILGVKGNPATGTVDPPTDPPGPDPALTLSDSGTIEIDEGSSRLFNFSIGAAVSSDVTVTCALSGSGAGGAISFASGSSDTSEAVTIPAGQTGGSIRVYARQDSDTSDETVTLTISTSNTDIPSGSRSDSVSIRADDDDTPAPTTTTFSLSPSSDQDIEEGDNELFTIRLGTTLSSAVTFDCDLSGSGAGSDVSFLSGSSSTSITRTINAGSRTATFRVYARDDDSSDDATLTVGTNSPLVTTSDIEVDIEPTAAPDPADYEATITIGRGNFSGSGYLLGPVNTKCDILCLPILH
ncbi:MAG: hypothetical protein F4147_05680, partial [Gammaproteobacteria bacterium]|nr:hypothetical protein [Gammaproteobacteria bacterium]